MFPCRSTPASAPPKCLHAPPCWVGSLSQVWESPKVSPVLRAEPCTLEGSQQLQPRLTASFTRGLPCSPMYPYYSIWALQPAMPRGNSAHQCTHSSHNIATIGGYMQPPQGIPHSMSLWWTGGTRVLGPTGHCLQEATLSRL